MDHIRQDSLHFHWLKDQASNVCHMFYEPMVFFFALSQYLHILSPITMTIAMTVQ